MQELIELDKQIFFFINGLHATWFDQFMYLVSKTWFWIPLHALFLYALIRKYNKHTWIFLLGLSLTILLSDQVTTTLMKPYFERLRPSHDPELQELVHIVNDYRGGKYGFASSHAANTFGAATFIFLALGNFNRWIKWIFAWAVLVTYSRIYLGVHYPGDVIAGGVIGAFFGYVLYRSCEKILSRISSE